MTTDDTAKFIEECEHIARHVNPPYQFKTDTDQPLNIRGIFIRLIAFAKQGVEMKKEMIALQCSVAAGVEYHQKHLAFLEAQIVEKDKRIAELDAQLKAIYKDENERMIEGAFKPTETEKATTFVKTLLGLDKHSGRIDPYIKEPQPTPEQLLRVYGK